MDQFLQFLIAFGVVLFLIHIIPSPIEKPRPEDEVQMIKNRYINEC